MRNRWRSGLVLFLFSVLPFVPVLECGFLNWDDDFYLTENPDISSPDGWSRTLDRFWSNANVYPLVFGVFRLEHALWGLNPLGYHLVNLILHGLVAVSFRSLFIKLSGSESISWWAALFFAVHPMQTATVAWVSELKSLLGSFFLLGAWHFYLEPQTSSFRYWWKFLLSLVLATAAYLSKSSLVVFPVMIVCTDWIQRQRPRSPLLSAIHFIPAWLLGWVYAHREIESGLSSVERLLIAPRALIHYVSTWFFPFHLLGVYPKWETTPWLSGNLISILGVIVLIGALFLFRHRVHHLVWTGVVLFLVPILPALGLVRFGYQKHSFVSDHFAYFAVSGLALILVSLVLRSDSSSEDLAEGDGFSDSHEIRRNTVGEFARKGFLGVFGVVWGILAWNQCGVWRTSEVFWRSTLAGNPNCWVAHENLATVLDRQDKMLEAEKHYQRAVEIDPNEPIGWINLGRNQIRSGQYRKALLSLEKAKSLNPHYPQIEELAREARRRMDRTSGKSD